MLFSLFCYGIKLEDFFLISVKNSGLFGLNVEI